MKSCPQCSQSGRKVKRATLESLLRSEIQPEISDGQYYVCSAPECETVYFNGQTEFTKANLRVRFGLKEATAPRPICYCFDHTVEEIHDEIAQSGQSTVLDSIKADMKGPGCRCEQTNPLGACCLNTVKAVVDDGFRSVGQSPTVVEVSEDCCSDDCCAPPSPNRSGAVAVGGSVIAAALSSACCWLPLVLLGFGASAAGVAGFFEQWRVPFIGIAVVLLGIGFYFQYFRKTQCADESCAPPSKRLRILNQSMLWVATVFIVAMILFPNYVQHLIGGSDSVAAKADGIELIVPVEGMTCEGCESILANSLSNVEGVSGVDVSYAEKRATVKVTSNEKSVQARIVDAVTKAGYQTRLEDIEVP